MGHKIADCWELESNKSKRPKNWKSKMETGNAAGDTEFLLICCDVDDHGVVVRDEDEDSSDDELFNVEDEDAMSLEDDEDRPERMYDSYSSGAEEPDNEPGHDVMAANVDREDDDEQQQRSSDQGGFGYATAAVQGYLAETYNYPTYTRVNPNVFATRESAREWMDNLDTQNWQDMQTLMHYSPQLQEVYSQLDISEAFDTIALWTRGRRDTWASDLAASEANVGMEPDRQRDEDEELESQDDNAGNVDRSNLAEPDEDDDENQREVAGVVAPKTLSDIIHSDYWVGDTGATTHLTNDATGMIDLVSSKQKMMMGNGSETKGAKEGTVKGSLCDKNGSTLAPITLSGVTYSKDAKLNLLSLTQLMKKGWTIGSDSSGISMTKGGQVLKFDVVINTPKGVLYCIRIKRSTSEAGNPNVDKVNNVIAPYATVHDWLGHMGKELTVATAKQLGIEVTGSDKAACEDCLTAKAKKKGVSKNSEHVPSDEVNGRIFLDLSSIKMPKDCPEVKKIYKPHWRMMVDEMTGLKFTDFF